MRLRPQETHLVRGMQAVLLVILLVGLVEQRPRIIANAGISLLVTFVPAMLQRRYDIPLHPGMAAWITAAVFLHAIGMFGPYRQVWWWDHLTHAAGAAVVAGAGYAIVRAIDEASDRIYFPPLFMFVFTLLMVMALGVVWEVIEYATMLVSTLAGDAWLTQYGVEDTVVDLIFDAFGGLLVAIWGETRLKHTITAMQQHIQTRAGRLMS